jgi:hypothetical protein
MSPGLPGKSMVCDAAVRTARFTERSTGLAVIENYRLMKRPIVAVCA